MKLPWFLRRTPSPAVRQIIDLIERYPQDWCKSEYWFSHSGGMAIWIANYAWALHVDAPKIGRVVHRSQNCNASYDQRCLWKAIQKWTHTGGPGSIDEYVRDAEQIAFERWRRDLNAKTDAEIDQYRQALLDTQPAD